MAAPLDSGPQLTQGDSEGEHFSPYRSDGKLYGFVCIVIGATHPVGQAIISELAYHGAASIYACTLPTSPPGPSSSSSPAPASSSSTQIIPYPYLPTEEGTLALIDDVLNAHGRLDVYVTLSTLVGPASLSSTTPAFVHACLDANALVPLHALKYAPPAMGKLCVVRGSYVNAAPKDQAYGSIIVVGAEGAEAGAAWQLSRAAAAGVVKAGVRELVRSGVRINEISYRGVEGGLGLDGQGGKLANGMKRAGRAEEVARVAGFLASGFSSYITGATMVVDGGSSALAS